MRIQHNILAMNSYRNYTNNTNALGRNLEKLSSGYKINRAGDDAAGLAISEKMRAQIKGLDAAQKNVKDGISLVKTAEGAMQEIQDMMSRMKYLATQSANGTYDDPVDRRALQDEVEQLLDEIDRIADSANFNGTKLLDGSLGGGGSAKVTKVDGKMATDPTITPITFKVSLADATGGGVVQGGKYRLTLNGGVATSAEVNLSAAETASAALAQAFDGLEIEISGVKYKITAEGNTLVFTEQKDDDGKLSATQDNPEATAPSGDATIVGAAAGMTGGVGLGSLGGALDSVTISGAQNGTWEEPGPKAAETTIDFTDKKGSDLDGATVEIGDKKFQFVTDTANLKEGYTAISIASTDTAEALASALQQALDGEIDDFDVVVDQADSKKVTITETTPTGSTKAIDVKMGSGTGGGDKGLQLQIGDTADSYNQLKVSINNMHASAIGVGGLDISTIGGATTAIDLVKEGINYVSAARGKLGAIQNRLEHTQNNLSVMAENIQDAESTIRDTDVADEMMGYVKNNILVQSAQAMLAQANQVPQGVLQLLG